MFATQVALPQKSPARVKYLKPETLTVNNGLSQGLVKCITQDHLGFMWFGTLDGLNRYDGYNITVFRHEPGDSNSVSENHITALFVDSKKRLWAGTSSGGLNLFDHRTESFVHLRHQKNFPNSLSDDRILSIQEDTYGTLWVGTKNGLNKITIAGTDEINPGEIKNSGHSFFTPQHVFIKRIRFDHSGKEFFSHISFDPSFFIDAHGIIFVETGNGFFSILPSANMNDSIKKLENLKSNPADEAAFANINASIKSSLEKPRFLYWMAKKFIGQIDVETGLVSLKNYAKPGLRIQDKTKPITSEYLWFEFNFLLYQYNTATHQAVEINSYEANEQLLISSAINIYKDRTGIIWVGCSGYGVARFNPFQEKFNRVKTMSIQFLYSKDSDEVTIKESNTFYRLQKNVLDSSSSHWEKSTGYLKEIYDQLNGKYLELAVPDTKGAVWLWGERTERYDPNKKKLQTILYRGYEGYDIYETENELWFSHSSLLSKINTTTLKETSYHIPVLAGLPGFYVETILKDAQNILWLAQQRAYLVLTNSNKNGINIHS